MEFLWRHQISYAECTLGNHVYYSRYLDMLERARGEFFRAIGFPLLALQLEDCAFPVVEVRVRYWAPARYDETLTIRLTLSALDRIRHTVGYQVSNTAGAPILEASTSHVCASLAERPKRMPPRLLEALRPYLISSPP